jgi:CspA family cold shock protein
VAQGKVKWFNRSKGYGFIEPEDGINDVFVHITEVQKAGIITLFQGQIISYDVQPVNENRITAINIVILIDISDAAKIGNEFEKKETSPTSSV